MTSTEEFDEAERPVRISAAVELARIYKIWYWRPQAVLPKPCNFFLGGLSLFVTERATWEKEAGKNG